ncbi:hypothetical protein A6K76_01625 [Caryophanon latum]|uniref:Uncharacterized protein n=2 Tax=Caryophanon latum TaxID=33977 RepID=A0A1C0YUC4_9BACL|nr:hypothetical protein A6K76_01625 [Caryophanon latum]
MLMMPCPICEAKSLNEVNMTGEYFEMKMNEPYMHAPPNDAPMYEDVATDKMMHGEVVDAIDEEVTSEFTVTVDDLKNRHAALPPEGMKFYAGDDDDDDALTKR